MDWEIVMLMDVEVESVLDLVAVNSSESDDDTDLVSEADRVNSSEREIDAVELCVTVGVAEADELTGRLRDVV